MKRLLAGAGLLLLVACDSSTDAPAGTGSAALSTPQTAVPAPEAPAEGLTSFSQRYLQQARRQCASALFEAQQLQASLETVLDQTGPEALAAAQSQWEKAHLSWLRCSLFSHNAGPLDTPAGEDPFPLSARIASWPISPGYVDSLPEHPFSGLVNSPDLALSRASLLEQHQLTAANESSVGLYPLETLLFGTDDSRTPEELSAAAEPAGDFSSQQRRREYLALLGALYSSDLKALVARWDPELASFPQSLARFNPHQQRLLLVEGLRERVLELGQEVLLLQEEESGTRHRQRLLVPLEALQLLAGEEELPALQQRIEPLLTRLGTAADNPEIDPALQAQFNELASDLGALLGDATDAIAAPPQ
ncbi:imelysin family protein [Aestuariirhabdus litorea]|nr:imelysin family protein [Aestuariirhabdus litorea]